MEKKSRHRNKDLKDAIGCKIESDSDLPSESQIPIKLVGGNKRQKKRTGTSKKSKAAKRLERDDWNLESAAISRPQLLSSDEERENKRERVMPDESTFSFNKFSPLPPISSDAISVRASTFMNITRKDSIGGRTKLPPIKRQPMDEKPDSNRKKNQPSGRKKEKNFITFELLHEREVKSKERLERHAQRRRETLDGWERERAAKIEKHLHKLDLAERNKEQIRQHRKRKLEYEEEKRRKAKERQNALKNKWRCESQEEIDHYIEPSQHKMPEI
eukprot:gene13598-4494_t